jgi:hypothetical protein
MSKPTPILAFFAVLLLVSLACSSGGIATPADPGLINTMVAETLAVLETQTAQPVIVTATATSTSTPELPTASPTVTLTPTPVFTATPSVPLISVSVATNCRVGPGRAYDRVGALLVGEFTEVYGRDLAGNYWYVRNPNVSGGFCWLWGEYATLAGNTQTLPIFTPPPTPTPAPAFVATYSGLESCAGTGWWVEIRLENTGGLTFKSILLAAADTTSNTTVSLSDNKFTNLNGCSSSDSRNTLAMGEKLIVSSPPFAYDPTGHNFRATITLCSDINVNGTCITRIVEFKP